MSADSPRPGRPRRALGIAASRRATRALRAYTSSAPASPTQPPPVSPLLLGPRHDPGSLSARAGDLRVMTVSSHAKRRRSGDFGARCAAAARPSTCSSCSERSPARIDDAGIASSMTCAARADRAVGSRPPYAPRADAIEKPVGRGDDPAQRGASRHRARALADGPRARDRDRHVQRALLRPDDRRDERADGVGVLPLLALAARRDRVHLGTAQVPRARREPRRARRADATQRADRGAARARTRRPRGERAVQHARAAADARCRGGRARDARARDTARRSPTLPRPSDAKRSRTRLGSIRRGR